MENIAIKWSIERADYMRLVKITGTVVNHIPNEDIVRLMLGIAINIIEIAENSRGIPFLLDRPPAKKNKNFVYFEIIFKNVTDYQTFLKAIENRLS